LKNYSAYLSRRFDWGCKGKLIFQTTKSIFENFLRTFGVSHLTGLIGVAKVNLFLKPPNLFFKTLLRTFGVSSSPLLLGLQK